MSEEPKWIPELPEIRPAQWPSLSGNMIEAIERRGRDDMMRAASLPMLDDAALRAAVLAMGFCLPGSAQNGEELAFEPVGWTKVAHPTDHRRYWFLDQHGVRRLEVFWKAAPHEPSHGDVTVLPQDGMAYMAPRDEERFEKRVESHGLRCRRCNLANVTAHDHFTIRDRPRAVAVAWMRLEGWAERHAKLCGKVRMMLVPRDQRPGEPPVFKPAVVADLDDDRPAQYMPVAWLDDTLRRPTMRSAGELSARGTRWKKHPPSKRRARKDWQDTGSLAKARYQPVARARRRCGFIPGWAHAPWEHEPLPMPEAVLRAYEVEVPRADKAMAILYAETEPAAEVVKAFRKLAQRALCKHNMLPVGPLQWLAPVRDAVCAWCDARGEIGMTGEVTLVQDMQEREP